METIALRTSVWQIQVFCGTVNIKWKEAQKQFDILNFISNF